MQSFNTKPEDAGTPESVAQMIIAGQVEEVPPGRSASVQLPDGAELALHNVNGEFYATENFCPHRGAPLAEGFLCGHVIECALHGWQFDVRDGKCLTADEPIKTYRVVLDDGVIKIEILSEPPAVAGG
jgi:nitrite reductase/ring-hydroxylating ferredoxin subunit